MKRRLCIIVIFLLAGAVVNVAVAWGCALWVPMGSSQVAPSGWREKSLRLLSQVPTAQPGVSWKASVHAERSGIGAHNEISWLRNAHKPEGHANLPPFDTSQQHAILIRCRAGLPLLSLEEFRADGGWELRRYAITPRWLSRWLLLPVRPLWTGFLTNTLFYAVVLWLLIPGPFVFRRLIRRFSRIERGLCPKCGYPMGESAVCTECGKTLPTRARATT